MPGGFGTADPAAGRAGGACPSVLIVPLLAFDPAGYRLGYGGGFYDRTLAKLRALGRGASRSALPMPGRRSMPCRARIL